MPSKPALAVAAGPSPCAVLLFLLLPALLLLLLAIDQITLCTTHAWIWDILYRLPSHCAVYGGLGAIILFVTLITLVFATILLHRKPSPKLTNLKLPNRGSGDKDEQGGGGCCCTLNTTQLVAITLLIAYLLTAILTGVSLLVVARDQQAVASDDLARKFRPALIHFETLVMEAKSRLSVLKKLTSGVASSFDGSPILQDGRFNHSLQSLQSIQFALGCCGLEKGVEDYLEPSGRPLVDSILPISCCARVDRKTIASNNVDWSLLLSETCWANRSLYPQLGCRKRMLEVFFYPLDAGLSYLLAAHILAIILAAVFIVVSGDYSSLFSSSSKKLTKGAGLEEEEEEDEEEEEEDGKENKESIPLQQMVTQTSQVSEFSAKTQVEAEAPSVENVVVETVKPEQVPYLSAKPKLMPKPATTSSNLGLFPKSSLPADTAPKVSFVSTSVDRRQRAPLLLPSPSPSSHFSPSPSTTFSPVPLLPPRTATVPDAEQTYTQTVMLQSGTKVAWQVRDDAENIHGTIIELPFPQPPSQPTTATKEWEDVAEEVDVPFPATSSVEFGNSTADFAADPAVYEVDEHVYANVNIFHRPAEDAKAVLMEANSFADARSPDHLSNKSEMYFAASETFSSAQSSPLPAQTYAQAAAHSAGSGAQVNFGFQVTGDPDDGDGGAGKGSSSAKSVGNPFVGAVQSSPLPLPPPPASFLPSSSKTDPPKKNMDRSFSDESYWSY
ncbi:hypothetical protein TYRP_016765 [Tyrophagus putrescentiae]|nr:hypothetical protein TYRP_016765 [Tyrophagus putrescentiae]